MHAVRQAGQRRRQPPIALANNRRAVHERRRARLTRDAFGRHILAVERTLTVRERAGQYAFANTTSYFAGSPVTIHFVGAGVERNSASGMQRIVAFVSSLTRASTAGSPFQPE